MGLRAASFELGSREGRCARPFLPDVTGVTEVALLRRDVARISYSDFTAGSNLI